MLVFCRVAGSKGMNMMADDCPWYVNGYFSANSAPTIMGLTIKDMMHEFGVSEKTVRRDLEPFRTRVPLQETVANFGRRDLAHGRQQGWAGPDIASTRPSLFTWAVVFWNPLAGTMFWEAAQRALRKSGPPWVPNASSTSTSSATIFHQTMVWAGDYTKKASVIDELMVGIEDRKAVFITYQSLIGYRAGHCERHFNPYGLIYHRGALYLVGRRRTGKRFATGRSAGSRMPK